MGGVHAWQGGHVWPGGMHGRGACVGRGHVWGGGMCGVGAGGMHGRQCASQGGVRGGGACVAGETATAADGTHPTGMLSCFNALFL